MHVKTRQYNSPRYINAPRNINEMKPLIFFFFFAIVSMVVYCIRNVLTLNTMSRGKESIRLPS